MDDLRAIENILAAIATINGFAIFSDICTVFALLFIGYKLHQSNLITQHYTIIVIRYITQQKNIDNE